MQNPQHLSMKPSRITDGCTIRREIFNLAQPSDSHRAVRSTDLLKLSDYLGLTCQKSFFHHARNITDFCAQLSLAENN